jgi:glutathione S-transferase
MSEPLRLYDYSASANCFKVRLLLAQLGLPYERLPVDIFNGDTLTDDYAGMNPMRTTPVLQIGDGRFIPESNAILVFLARGTEFLPEDAFELAQVIRWLIYEQTEVVPMIGGLRFRLLTGRLRPSDRDAVRRRHAALEILGQLDQHLARREFFVGRRYTIADIAIHGYVHVAGEAQLDLQPYASVRGWLTRVGQTPRYVEDLAPYGANARPRAGQSIYD